MKRYRRHPLSSYLFLLCSDLKHISNLQKETLLVVVPDHETAGFAINGPYGTFLEQGELVEDAWTSGGHTGVDVLIWAQGPISSQFGKALDNTELYYLMKEALK